MVSTKDPNRLLFSMEHHFTAVFSCATKLNARYHQNSDEHSPFALKPKIRNKIFSIKIYWPVSNISHP